MENNEFRLSINAKTIILILLLLNVGYAYKKIKQYNHIKETGYIRERTVQEEIRKRIMKSFGSVEEMDLLVDDFAKQKEDAEKLASTIREQDKQLSKAYKDLKVATSKNRDEKDYLHKKIRGMADGFSKRKDQYGQMSKLKEVMKDAKSKFETEKARLEKKIRDLENLLPERKNR
jgi:aldehyde:ferredoxin oxidoreductase